MLSSDEMSELISAGVTAEQLLIFTKIIEARLADSISAKEKKRVGDRERKRKSRGSHAEVTRTSVEFPVTSVDIPFPSPSPAPSLLSPTPPNNPSLTLPTPPSPIPTKAKKAILVLPDWLPEKDWLDFYEMRKTMPGKPFTGRAQELALERLEELRKSGNDPGQVLQRSILNGWKGLFKLEGNNHETYRQPNRNSAQAGSGNQARGFQPGATARSADAERIGVFAEILRDRNAEAYPGPEERDYLGTG